MAGRNSVIASNQPSATPLADPEHGAIRGAVVTFLDITERKHTEEHARDLQAELAHVSRLSTMGEMASGLAHELNQPVAADDTPRLGDARCRQPRPAAGLVTDPARFGQALEHAGDRRGRW